jgi:mono/diheme cytochrome c family protein
MTSRTRRVLGALVLASTVVAAGCARGCTSSRPPIHINPSMDDQAKVLPQTDSPFFFNGASMRDPVPGTVAIDGLKEDTALFTGKGEDGKYVATIPLPMDDAFLARGHQRYTIYCQPCHDARGDGRGILFQRASVPTGNYHTEKILKYTDGEIFDVISNGRGLMSGYRWPIPVSDRWAIVAYVRELQRQRQARAANAPAAASTPASTPASAPASAPASSPASSPASAPAPTPATTPATRP